MKIEKINKLSELQPTLKNPIGIGKFRYKDKLITVTGVSTTVKNRVNKVYARRREAGLCYRCGKKKPAKGYKTCNICLKKSRGD